MCRHFINSYSQIFIGAGKLFYFDTYRVSCPVIMTSHHESIRQEILATLFVGLICHGHAKQCRRCNGTDWFRMSVRVQNTEMLPHQKRASSRSSLCVIWYLRIGKEEKYELPPKLIMENPVMVDACSWNHIEPYNWPPPLEMQQLGWMAAVWPILDIWIQARTVDPIHTKMCYECINKIRKKCRCVVAEYLES